MSGWRQVALRYLAQEWCDGPFGSAIATEHYRDVGARIVRLQNIRAVAFDDRDSAFLDEDYFRTSLIRHDVRAGDVLIAGLGDDNNLVGRACVAPAGLGPALVKADCFRFRMDLAKADPRFVAYALSSSAEVAGGELANGSTRQRINLSSMAGRTILAPGTHEQTRIANFLDEQTARIDALIAEKDRLASAVREYEQAQISQLLARGIKGGPFIDARNPYVPVAPGHWRVIPFKRALLGMEQGWSPQCENHPAGEGEWGVLKVGCVNGTMFNASENKALPSELAPDLSCVIQRGDVLISRANTRELVGSAALVQDDYPNLLLCDKLYRLKLNSDWVTADFAVLLLRSDTARRQIELGASGASSSMQNISQDVLRELVVALPPPEEQTEIVQRARTIRASADDLARHIKVHVDRLREYRSSLISATVTGQFDINSYREAA